MKKSFLFLLANSLTAIVSAQMQIGFHYNIKKNIKISYSVSDTSFDASKKILGIQINQYLPGVITSSTSTDNSGTYPITTTLYPALVMCDKLKAGVVQKEKDISGKIFISFWGIDSEKNCAAASFVNKSKKLGEFYYQLPLQLTLGDIASFKGINFATTEVGVATVPFKYRFGYKKDTTMVPNDFSAGVNVGIYVGRRWGRTRFYVDQTKSKNVSSFLLGGFLSPTIISIDKDNSFPNSDSIISKKLKLKSNQLGISTGLAASFSLNKDFNIGIFLGFDFGITSPSKEWFYHSKPWIGFGIGYKLAILGEK